MASNPELQQLLALSRDRTAYQNPLFQAVTQMAYRGLPTYAREGTSLSGSLSNQAPPVQPQAQGDGFDMGDLMKVLAGAAGGSALSDILRGNPGGGGLLGDAIKGIKKLFGLGDGRDTVQGDQPFGGGALTGPMAFDPREFMGWDHSGGWGAGGMGDQGPWWDVSDQWGGGGLGDQGPVSGGPTWPETPTPFAPFDPRQLGGGESFPTGTYWWED